MSDLIKKSDDVNPEVMPSFDFMFETEIEQQSRNAEHRAWLKSIKRERPLPKHHFKVAVYIRYFNQTKHKDYLAFHKQQFQKTLELCPNWDFIGFYIDDGGIAPNMESAEAWSRLLQDCYDGKVDLIITQKTSNISKKPMELTFCARLLASLEKPVGIYFISEDIYTMASYYQADLKDSYFMPPLDWRLLPDEKPDMRGLLNE